MGEGTGTRKSSWAREHGTLRKKLEGRGTDLANVTRGRGQRTAKSIGERATDQQKLIGGRPTAQKVSRRGDNNGPLKKHSCNDTNGETLATSNQTIAQQANK